MFKHASAIAVASLALAACGGEERLTKQQFSEKATAQIERVSAGFGAVFSTIGEAAESDPVPAAALQKLRDAAGTEAQAVSAIDALVPPEAAEAPVDRFLVAARAQAKRLEALAGGSATVEEVADAIEDPAVGEALTGLSVKGYAEMPER